MRMQGTISVSGGYHTSGLGAASRQKERGEGFYVANPLTANDYAWLRRTVKGWTAKKFAYHGMTWPPKNGWRKKLLAQEHISAPKPQNLTQPAWNYAIDDAERDRREMKKLYQEKSGDYSY